MNDKSRASPHVKCGLSSNTQRASDYAGKIRSTPAVLRSPRFIVRQSYPVGSCRLSINVLMASSALQVCTNACNLLRPALIPFDTTLCAPLIAHFTMSGFHRRVILAAALVLPSSCTVATAVAHHDRAADMATGSVTHVDHAGERVGGMDGARRWSLSLVVGPEPLEPFNRRHLPEEPAKTWDANCQQHLLLSRSERRCSQRKM